MKACLLLSGCGEGALTTTIPSPRLSMIKGSYGISCSSSRCRAILGGWLTIVIDLKSELSNSGDVFIQITSTK
jgi:hypothetical protein